LAAIEAVTRNKVKNMTKTPVRERKVDLGAPGEVEPRHRKEPDDGTESDLDHGRMHTGDLSKLRLLLDGLTERPIVEGASVNPFQQRSNMVRPRGAGKIELDRKGSH
jgi:hypothetical protein